jgi:DNA-binding transcriptional MocR family regulator
LTVTVRADRYFPAMAGSGSHVWARRLAQDCERAGLLVAPGTEWFPAEPAGAFLRLNYSGPDPSAFADGARILGEALDRASR